MKHAANNISLHLLIYHSVGFNSKLLYRGYYTSVRRYKICLQVFKNISRVSPEIFFQHDREILYLQATM